jgi:AcrR family transcriptional regulator
MGLDGALVDRIRDGLGTREWHAVTVADLAAAAGVSRMTLHRRGIGKDEVLEELGRRLEEEQRDALVDVLAAGGPARERLRRALDALCDVDERYLAVLAALGSRMDAIYHEPGAPDQPVLTRAGFTDGLRRLLADGRVDGSVHVEDPELMATLVYNAVGHTYRHMRMGHRWSAADARRRVVDLIVDGLPGPGRPA